MRFGIVALLAATATLAGCASQNPERGTFATVQRETTPDKLYQRGRAFAAVGDYTRAEQYLTAALESGGDETLIMPLLLRVCVAGERYRVAIDYAKDYLRRHPDDVRLRLVLGSLQGAIGERTEAVAELRDVVEKAPREPDAHFILATFLQEDGDRDEAQEHLREYLRLDPKGRHAAEARTLLEERAP